MKKTMKIFLLVFAVAFGMMLFTGTSSAATAITGLTQTKSYTNSVSVKWDAVLGTGNYTVSISTDQKTWVDESAYKNTEDTLSGLSEGATYYVKVTAYTANKEILAQSSVIQVLTALPDVANLAQTYANANSISMSWSAVNGASGYTVYRYNSYNNYTAIGNTSSTSFTATGLGSSNEVRYFVTASKTSDSGFTVSSRNYTTKTMRTAPSTPANIAMTSFYNSLNSCYYGWNSSLNTDGYQFQIYNTKNKKLMDKSQTGTSIYVSPFWKGTFVKARVRAYIIVGNTKCYSPWTGYTYNAASKKLTYKRSANKKKIKLTWKKITGACGYQVYVSTKSTSGFKKVKTLSSKKTSYTITKCGKKKLSKKKVYYVQLRYQTKVGGKKVTSSVMGAASVY